MRPRGKTSFRNRPLRSLLLLQLFSYPPKFHETEARSGTKKSAHHDDHLHVHWCGLLSRLCPATASNLRPSQKYITRKIQQKARPCCCYSSFVTSPIGFKIEAQNRPAARYNSLSCPDIPLWYLCTMSRRTSPISMIA